MVEKDYTPRGWLGILIGEKVYYNFFTTDLANTDMEKLLKVLIGTEGKYFFFVNYQPLYVQADPNKCDYFFKAYFCTIPKMTHVILVDV